MFAHIYRFRLKCHLRDRSNLFWTLLFPLVLGTFFYLSFGHIDSYYTFSRIPVGVVDNTAWRQNAAFQKTLKSASAGANGGRLFSVKVLSASGAEKALKNGTVKGYLIPGGSEADGTFSLKNVVKESDIDQTVIKTFADDYLQTEAAYRDIASSDFSALKTAVQVKTVSFIRSVSLSRHTSDSAATYFYALIAMACLYGSFWGLREIDAVQANQSPQGARVNMAPIHKLRVFLSSLCAALTIQTAGVFLLIGYLALVLHVPFGTQIGFVLLAGFIGSVTGVMLGAMLSALIKKSTGVKVAILISVSMTLSFLAGLMFDQMKYIVETKMPALSYLNPANLVADAFYALYDYDTLNRYLLNIELLAAFAVFFFFMTYFALRRQKYESL